MREIGALFRASWLSETSYRLNMVFSLGSLVFVVVPLYFVANALQPVMGPTISSQGQQYFGFALIGAVVYTFIAACTSALPNAVASAIGRGTLEAFLATPTRVPALFAGMSAYGVAWALLRGIVMLGSGIALGARLHWNGLPIALGVIALLALAYGAVGLFACALLIRFRTTGPLIGAVLTGSALLGGVYYPTHVIPSWLQNLSQLLPLSYGLRAARQALLLAGPTHVAHDVLALAFCTAVLFPLGALSLVFSLRYAKRAGTLAHY